MKKITILAAVLMAAAASAYAADLSSLENTASALAAAQTQGFEMSQDSMNKAWDSGLKLDAGAPPVVMNAPAAAPAAEVKVAENTTIKGSIGKHALAAKVPALKEQSWKEHRSMGFIGAILLLGALSAISVTLAIMCFMPVMSTYDKFFQYH